MPLQGRFSRFWQEDRGLSFLLLFLVITIVVSPLRGLGALGELLLFLVFAAMLVSGVVAVSRRPWTGFVAGVIAVSVVALERAGRWSAAPALEAAGTLASLLFAGILAAVVLAQVLRRGRITIHRIVGSAAAYLLIGFMWGEMYHLLWVFVPGAFVASNFPSLGPAEFYYFSIVTLTTLGYGDITPVHSLARTLAILEALTGQLFPAILIARLVSMELLDRDRESSQK